MRRRRFYDEDKRSPNDCDASDVGAARRIAFIAAAVAAVFGHASCDQFGLDGLQRLVRC